MEKQITLPAQVHGCTLQIVHAGKASFIAPWSVSLYARATTPGGVGALQLAYAPADELVLSTAQCTGYTLSARFGGQITCIFEIAHDTALAIAAFAGLAMPEQDQAA